MKKLQHLTLICLLALICGLALTGCQSSQPQGEVEKTVSTKEGETLHLSTTVSKGRVIIVVIGDDSKVYYYDKLTADFNYALNSSKDIVYTIKSDYQDTDAKVDIYVTDVSGNRIYD